MSSAAAEPSPPAFGFDYNARYRYDHAERDASPTLGAAAHAHASTLRLAAIAWLRPQRSMELVGEIEQVLQLGADDYYIPGVPGQGRPGQPVIPDPEGGEIHRAYLQWTAAETLRFRAGRQELSLHEGRFLTVSQWRQNRQSFDAVAVRWTPGPAWRLDYAYFWRALRPTGADAHDGRARLNAHIAEIHRDFGDRASASLWGLWLDADPVDRSDLTSTQTHGLRLTARHPLRSGLGAFGVLELAHQSDFANHPQSVSAAFVRVDAGLSSGGGELFLAYRRLEGRSATDKLSTPLGHPFDGQTDLFRLTPSLNGRAHGLQVYGLGLRAHSPRLPGVELRLAGYRYRPDTGSADYGRELDVELRYVPAWIDPRLALTLRAARYDAAELYSDTTRTSITLSWRL